MAKTSTKNTAPLSFTKEQLTNIGNTLRVAREKKNLSQLEVARRAFNLEKSHAKVSRLERGIIQPTRQQLSAVARVLRIPVGQLIAA